MSEIVRLDFERCVSESGDRMARNVGVGATFPLHNHTFYEYFLVTRGRAFHMVNGASQLLTRGSLVLIRPADMHYYDYYSKDDFEFLNVGMSVEEFRRAARYYGVEEWEIARPALPPHVRLNEDSVAALERALGELLRTAPGERRTRMFLQALSVVLCQVLNGGDGEADSGLPVWLVEVLNAMEQPENFIDGLARLLQLSHYSQAHVNRSFRQYLYTTPTHYINDLRLRYAHKLLTTTSRSVAEVCGMCGFNNVSYFYTVFKKRFGCCPNALRLGTGGAT